MAQATNYTGESQLPWWALIVIIILAFLLCVFYSALAGIVGFYQFSSGGTGSVPSPAFSPRPALDLISSWRPSQLLPDALLVLRPWQAVRLRSAEPASRRQRPNALSPPCFPSGSPT